MFTNIKKLFKAKEEEIKELKLDKFQLFLDLVNSYLKREYPNITFDLSLYENNEEEDKNEEEEKKDEKRIENNIELLTNIKSAGIILKPSSP